MNVLRAAMEALPAREIFDEARAVLEEGYPAWAGTHLEIIGAELGRGGPPFLLAHEPDGPWMAVCPLEPAALEAMELPASPWAETQRWSPIFALRGHRGGDGSWWLEEVRVVE